MCRRLDHPAFFLLLSLVSAPLRATAPPAFHEGKALKAWIEQLRSPNSIPRGDAALALARLGPGAKPAIPALIQLLGRKDDYLAQFCAAHVLEAIGPGAREAVPALLPALLSRDYFRRPLQEKVFKALDAIGPEGTKAAISFLRKTLRDREAGERSWSAAEALGVLGPRAKGALPELVTASDGRDRSLRVHAAEALWHIEKSKHSVPVLLAVLKARDEKDGHARRHAVDALGRMRPVAPGVVAALAEIVRDASRPYDRIGAVSALEAIGPAAREAVPALVELLRDSDSIMRTRAALVLRAIGPGAREAVPALCLALTDEYEGMRSGAAYALWEVGKTDRDKLGTLRKAMKDEKVWVRIQSAWFLAGSDRAAAAEAVPVLTAALTGREGRACCAAAYLLGNMRRSWLFDDAEFKKALPALEKALSDRRPEVRRAVKRAIKDIDPERYRKLGLK